MHRLVDKLLENDDLDLRDEIDAFSNVDRIFKQHGYIYSPRAREYRKLFPLDPAWTVGQFDWTALRVRFLGSGPKWFVSLQSGIGTPDQWRYEAVWDNLGSYQFRPSDEAPAVAVSTALEGIERLMAERQSYVRNVQRFVSDFGQTRPPQDMTVESMLEDEEGMEMDAEDMVRAATKAGVDFVTIKELRSVFNRMGYSSSVYRRKAHDEVLVSGTPTDREREVTWRDLRAVADRVKGVLEHSGVPTLEATIFGWNKKLPGPGIQDYETTGRNRIYVTIVNNLAGNHDNAISVHGHVPENLEDDFDMEDAMHGMTMSAEEAHRSLPSLGYTKYPARRNMYVKFIKTLEHPSGPYALSVFVVLVGDGKAAFVFLGREAESTQRLGMANSWIKAFPNDLERFLPGLEQTLQRYRHTDQILTFAAKHPELVLTGLDAKNEQLW